jgi:hypothetical protein
VHFFTAGIIHPQAIKINLGGVLQRIFPNLPAYKGGVCFLPRGGVVVKILPRENKLPSPLIFGLVASLFFLGIHYQIAADDACCKECKTCQASALQFPPREGWHLILPVEAIDGDTVRFFWLISDVGRLNGINATELKTPGGPEAKAFLQKMLPGTPCKVKVLGREKYGRALIDLFIEDVSVSKKLIQAGHAKPWDGKGARP